MFCARVKITLDVLCKSQNNIRGFGIANIFLFSEEGWIGLSEYGIPNSVPLILRFASVDNLQPPKFTWDCDTTITYLQNDVALIFVHLALKQSYRAY